MAFPWKDFTIKRFLGLDLKTNIVDVVDGRSLDTDNIFMRANGSPGKRPGDELMFSNDEAAAIQIDELGTCTILGTKYFFKFCDGKFKHALNLGGVLTTIAPAPPISTVNQIWWAVLDDKLFFVDGTNVLRYFNGVAILTSSIYARPTVAPTQLVATPGTFTYTYTVDNGLGESPACLNVLPSRSSAAIIRIAGNTGPQTLIAGDTVRIYSKADTIAAANKLVATYVWTPANVAATFADINTVAISDAQPQLYTELGIAINKSAPVGLVGITVHYSRLVGWKTSFVYNSKVTNPHAWPDDAAQHEAFVYGFGDGDGETINRCISFMEALYVMKPSNIAVFGGIGPDDVGNNAYTFRRLETNGKGCIAGKSVCTIGEQGRLMMVYLSDTGFMGTSGSVPIEIGEEIETAIQAQTRATLATSYAIYDRKLGLYYCAVGPAPTARTIYTLDVRQNTVGDQVLLTGWFKWSKNTVKCMFYDVDRAFFGTYDGLSMSQRVAGIPSDFSDVKQCYINPPAVQPSPADFIIITVPFNTGDAVTFRNNGGALPGGIVAGTTYYVIEFIGNLIIKLATTRDNALAGIHILITSQGTGVHSMVGSSAINAYYDTNWMHFNKPLMVKKVGKIGLVFNAIAPQVSLTIQTAYDWVPNYTDPKTIEGGANDAWGDGDAWGQFVWGGGEVASPLNYAIPKRKFRSIRFRLSNSNLNQDFNIQSLNIPFSFIRNRGNFG